MYIRFQKIKRDEQGNIISGSASLEDTIYVPNVSGHSRHRILESLGKVLWIDEDKKGGIFNSKTRGIVHYSLATDTWTAVDPTDPRISHSKVTSKENIHTTFADAYLFLSLMEKSNWLGILRKAYPDQSFYQLLLTHLCHNILKNESAIKCQSFYSRSLISWLFKDVHQGTLDCDSAFFNKMGNDSIKVEFFKNLINYQREKNPLFGSVCYVDSTPLPGDAKNNPWNNFCSHGVGHAEKQTRMVLILDACSGLPVWFDFLYGNINDVSTMERLCEDIETTLDIKINSATLDAGYACESLFQKFNIDNAIEEDQDNNKTERSLIVRMPLKQGFPYGDLYQQCKGLFHDFAHQFDRKEHTYFGKCIEQKVGEYKEYCYVYLDKGQALALGRKYRIENQEEWDKLTKDEQEWLNYKEGFFILISNTKKSPKDILNEYLNRGSIERVFKTNKSFLDLLPLAKWNKETIKGKVLLEIIEFIMYQELERVAVKCGIEVNRMLTQLNGLESLKLKTEVASVKIPNPQIRNIFENANITLPGHLDLQAFKKMIMDGEAMEEIPLTVQKKRAGRKKKEIKVNVPLSTEQKQQQKEQEKQEKKKEREEAKKAKAEAKKKEKEKEKMLKEAKRIIEQDKIRKEKEAMDKK